MAAIKYNPFRKGQLYHQTYNSPSKSSKEKQAFLLGEDPDSQTVQFLVKMTLSKRPSINWYHLLTRERKKILGSSYSEFQAMHDEIIQKGYEIEHLSIRENDIDAWVAHGRQEAQRLNLKIEETTKTKLMRTAHTSFPKIQIEHLFIKDIKCFHQVTIPFYPISVLMGENARGKSTILQLLALGLSNIQRVPFSHNWKRIVNIHQKTGSFSIELRKQSDLILLEFVIDKNDTITCVQGEEYLTQIKEEILLLGYGVNRTVKLEEPPQYKDISNVATLFGENSYLKHIKISEIFQYVNEHFDTLKRLLNPVLYSADSENPVTLEYYDAESFYFRTPSNQDVAIPIEALSEGFKSTFAWLLDMMLRIIERGGDIDNVHNISGIVLLDEIDLHLHPVWQRKILSTLEQLFPSIQFIVTTHSPFIVQSVGQGNVVELNVRRETQEVRISPPRPPIEISYRATARELFHIQSPFSYPIEQKMQEFQDLKTALLKKEPVDEVQFKELIEELVSRGVEVEGVLRREIRDLERRLGREIGL